MTLTRRVAIAQLAASSALGGWLLRPADAFAETTQYKYDALGRLVFVALSDGSSVQYSYDAAGNRTSVVRASTTPSDTFTATIQITGASGVNLRTLANTAGYTGDKHANVTFQLASGVAITAAAGSPAVRAIDSGDWPYTLYQITLALQVSGSAIGGGGNGGGGNGNDGGAGGDAVYCRLPMSVTVNSGGLIKGGGGGGGGGGRDRVPSGGGEFLFYGGGGGGGGQPNGGAGAGGTAADGNGSAGTAGTASAHGNGGAGANGNDGGAGAAYAASGTAGDSAYQAGGAAGAAGYGVRKNGFTVTVTNNGTIVGTVG